MLFFRVCLILCLYFCKCQADGISPVLIGGNLSPVNKFPWMVTLGYKTRNVHCAGVIISKQYVLTAAHCISGGPYEYKDPPIDSDGKITDKDFVADFIIGAGSNDVENPLQKLPAEEIVRHPNFTMNDYKSADIAVIKLSSSLQTSENITVACLPENKCLNQPSDKGIIAGWGEIKEKVKTYKLMEGNGVHIWENEECGKEMKIPINEYAICAGGKGRPTSCPGDSGGPLFVRKDLKHYVIGLTSYGSEVCGNESPVLFTRVSAFLKWIQDHSDYSPDSYCDFPKGETC